MECRALQNEKKAKKKKNVPRGFDAVIQRTCMAFERATKVEVPKDTSSATEKTIL